MTKKKSIAKAKTQLCFIAICPKCNYRNLIKLRHQPSNKDNSIYQSWTYYPDRVCCTKCEQVSETEIDNHEAAEGLKELDDEFFVNGTDI